MIPFGDYSPDLADLNGPGAPVAENVYPHPQGFTPVKDLVTYGDALTNRCRGFITTRSALGIVYIYAGHETGIEHLNGTSFTDRTRSADPYALGAKDNWEFVQWQDTVIE